MGGGPDRLARGHAYVQRMLADEAIAKERREFWRAMYEVLAPQADVEDLVYLARRLKTLKDVAAGGPVAKG